MGVSGVMGKPERDTPHVLTSVAALVVESQASEKAFQKTLPGLFLPRKRRQRFRHHLRTKKIFFGAVVAFLGFHPSHADLQQAIRGNEADGGPERTRVQRLLVSSYWGFGSVKWFHGTFTSDDSPEHYLEDSEGLTPCNRLVYGTPP
jgi:hypothetical protein